MPKISPLSVVDPKAVLADDVEVGPFCAVGPDVTIGAGTRLISHVAIYGRCRIGRRNVIFPNAAIGCQPQDLKYEGEATGLEIGDDNHIREHVTIHPGTAYGGKVNGGGVTRVGDDNLLMVNAHIGHDAQIGSHIVIANNAMIAGHVVIGDHVVVSAAAGLNAFVSVGHFAYIGGCARIHHDAPPFMKINEQDKVRAVNSTGMCRAGMSQPDIDAIEEAARRLFRDRKKPFAQALAEFDTLNGLHPRVKQLVEFLRRRDQGKFGRYLESLRPG
jgi:UDP-N-acetylglucosamine acyltransferase